MRIGALAAVLVAAATSANAQTVVQPIIPQMQSAFAEGATIRVTSAFRVAAQVAEGQQIPAPKTQEAARREIYQNAENECAVLAEIHKGECRLSGVTIHQFFQPPNAPLQNWINATASYEIRVKR